MGLKTQLPNCDLFFLKSSSFNVRKTKKIAKFDGIEPLCFEYINGIVAKGVARGVMGCP